MAMQHWPTAIQLNGCSGSSLDTWNGASEEMGCLKTEDGGFVSKVTKGGKRTFAAYLPNVSNTRQSRRGGDSQLWHVSGSLFVILDKTGTPFSNLLITMDRVTNLLRNRRLLANFLSFR